jgi:hypothetical protein
MPKTDGSVRVDLRGLQLLGEQHPVLSTENTKTDRKKTKQKRDFQPSMDHNDTFEKGSFWSWTRVANAWKAHSIASSNDFTNHCHLVWNVIDQPQ